MNIRLRDVLSAIPAVAALGIALLYAVGAIIKSGQLRGAGLNVRDTLPLVPLPQLLALGIGTLVTSILFFASAAFIVWLYLKKFRDWGFHEVHTPPPRWWVWVSSRRYPVVIYKLVLLYIAISYFWSYSFFTAAAWTAGIYLSVYAVQTYRGQRYVAKVLVTYYVVLVLADTGQAYFQPAPLPQARVTLWSGATVSGALITTDGGTWYIKTSARHFESLPASDVKDVTVITVKREHRPRPVLKVVWYRVRSWF